MAKKYLIGLSLIAISFCFASSVSFAASTSTATSTATSTKVTLKPAVAKAVANFAKIFAAARVLDNKIGAPIQDVDKKMTSVSTLAATDYAGRIKLVSSSITEINSALALIVKQNAKLGTLKSAAAAIKDAKIKASGQRIAKDYIAIYLPLKDMIKAERDVLVIVKNELTRQSKGQALSANYTTKIEALQKKVNADNVKLGSVSKEAAAAQAEFEKLTGTKLAQ